MKFVRLSILILFLLSVFQVSCRKQFNARPSSGDFRVSTDTVFLDSVFTGISSPTYSFKIYNLSSEAILIDKIEPLNGQNSFYRLNVDGEAGKIFTDVLIPPQDSIYVFVELTADISQMSDPVYEEKLLIRDRIYTDTVLLTSFVKDAYFLYPKRFSDLSVDSIQVGTYQNGQPIKVPGFFISQDTTITDEKPVVIYGHLGVPPGKTLTIEAGAHLYFHFNSGIIVYEDASLHINGTLDNPVILEDDRMQPDYENVPGMWNFIWLKAGSKNNRIEYAIVKNAVAGVIAHPVNQNGDKVLEINNTQIYNMSAYGLISIASYVEGYNLVINNCGASSLALLLGGQYDFKHCTFANYSNTIRNHTQAAVVLSNKYETYDQSGNPVVLINDMNFCNISNTIVYGNQPIEFFVSKNDGALMNFYLKNSLIKFEDPQNRFNDDFLDFNNPVYYSSNLINAYPDFENPQENLMRIGLQSDAIGMGDPNITALVPTDILGIDRTDSPDAGAYKHTDLSGN